MREKEGEEMEGERGGERKKGEERRGKRISVAKREKERDDLSYS